MPITQLIVSRFKCWIARNLRTIKAHLLIASDLLSEKKNRAKCKKSRREQSTKSPWQCGIHYAPRLQCSKIVGRKARYPKETWPTTDENEERQDAPAALRPLPSLTTARTVAVIAKDVFISTTDRSWRTLTRPATTLLTVTDPDELLPCLDVISVLYPSIIHSLGDNFTWGLIRGLIRPFHSPQVPSELIRGRTRLRQPCKNTMFPTRQPREITSSLADLSVTRFVWDALFFPIFKKKLIRCTGFFSKEKI